MLEWFSGEVFSLFMWDSLFLVNEISHSMLSLSFFKFEINDIWIQFLNNYMTYFHIHVTTSQTVYVGTVASTVTFGVCVCDPVFHMHDWVMQLVLVTSDEKGAKIKAHLIFCVVFNFLCWSCCEEEVREKVSRDVTDSRSDTFSRSSNGCSIASIKLYSVGTGSLWSRTLLQVYLAEYSLNSHCFEEYPHCHNRTPTPFSLLILAFSLIHQNISRAQKDRWLIANNQKQLMIVFPYRFFPAFALPLVINKM